MGLDCSKASWVVAGDGLQGPGWERESREEAVQHLDADGGQRGSKGGRWKGADAQELTGF